MSPRLFKINSKVISARVGTADLQREGGGWNICCGMIQRWAADSEQHLQSCASKHATSNSLIKCEANSEMKKTKETFI